MWSARVPKPPDTRGPNSGASNNFIHSIATANQMLHGIGQLEIAYSAVTSVAKSVRTMMRMAVVVIVLMTAPVASGQIIQESDIPSPILDEDPFDILFLDERNDNAIIKIEPNDAAMLTERPSKGTLIFEFREESESLLEVPWANITSYKPYRQLVLEEADRYIADGKYADAFRNLLYVSDNGGKNDPEVQEKIELALFQDAKNNFSDGQFELALSMFEDLYRKDPNFRVPGIDLSLLEIILASHNGLIQKKFDRGDFAGVQSRVGALVSQYGDSAKKLSDQWQKKFIQRGRDLLVEARQFARAGNGREAHLAARRAERIIPNEEEVLKLRELIMQRFPMVMVGVSQGAGDADPGRIDDWGSRRVGRLTQRRIVEMTGMSDEGGVYTFLNGTLTRTDSIGLEYTFDIRENEKQFGVPPVTASMIARRLLDYATPSSPNYHVSWARIVDTISIGENSQVIVRLRTPFIRPEALLQIAYVDPGPDGKPVQNGKYVMTSSDDYFSTFEVNPAYPPMDDRQHPVIIEQNFGSASAAVDALIRGDVDVVDRISMADIRRLREEPDIELRPHTIPTIHMLVPKIRGDLADNSMFRTSLSTSINREEIVGNLICGGLEIDGCTTISGPFPIGSDDNDQISYGYDLKVKPLQFSNTLGMVLMQIALRPMNAPKPPPAEDGAEPAAAPLTLSPPALVLVHSTSSTAREASTAISQMWGEIGVTTTLRELKPGETWPADDNWDMLYVEAIIEEPLVDAERILGTGGLANAISAPVEQSLRIAGSTHSWQDACRALRRIHRQIANDLSVIPLYQVREQFAFRTTVYGMGRDIIHLYQNVDRWQIDATASEDATRVGEVR